MLRLRVKVVSIKIDILSLKIGVLRLKIDYNYFFLWVGPSDGYHSLI